MKRLLPMLLATALLLSGAVAAAHDETPTLAFLRFGQHPVYALTEKAVLDTLEAYGMINADERASLGSGGDLRGENINILYRDAGFDFPTASLMVEDALDEGADVFLTISNEVGMIAAGAMTELEDPPALIFAIVTAPHQAGLASAACVKPANVTGTQMFIDYTQIDQVRGAQLPDLKVFGIILDPNDPGMESVRTTMNEYAAMHGMQVEIATAITAADYSLAAESLMDRGVETIVLQARTGSPAPALAVLEAAYGIPIFSILVTDVFIGVPIGSGFQGWYREGVVAGRMAAAYLRGELDIARTGISTTPGFALAVNVDAAERQGFEPTEELLARADFIIEGGAQLGETLEIPGVNTFLEDIPLEERIAADAEFLAGLHCSDEMIAEQQAALDAASE